MVKFGADNVKEAMRLGSEAAIKVSKKFISPIKLEFEKVSVDAQRGSRSLAHARTQRTMRAERVWAARTSTERAAHPEPLVLVSVRLVLVASLLVISPTF